MSAAITFATTRRILRAGRGDLLSRLARYRRDSWTTGASFLHQVG